MIRYIATIALFAGLSANAALADRKPARSKAPDPMAIVEMVSGKSWDWTEGGAYFAKDGAFTAFWKGNKTTGKWYVTSRKATMCYEGVWRETVSDQNTDITKLCWQHVVDQDGKIWQKHHEKNDWYPVSPTRYTEGFRFQALDAAFKAK